MGTPERTGLADTVGPFWSAEAVSDALGVAPAPGSVLVVLTSDGVPLYPVSQFVEHDRRIVVAPGIADMLHILGRFDPWAIAVLLETPADELDGATPLTWAKHGGDPTALADLADQVAREWSAGSMGQPGD